MDGLHFSCNRVTLAQTPVVQSMSSFSYSRTTIENFGTRRKDRTMRVKLIATILLAGLFNICVAADSAQFLIQKQYPLTALSADGTSVVHAGTILVIQTPNIYATSAV